MLLADLGLDGCISMGSGVYPWLVNLRDGMTGGSFRGRLGGVRAGACLSGAGSEGTGVEYQCIFGGEGGTLGWFVVSGGFVVEGWFVWVERGG